MALPQPGGLLNVGSYGRVLAQEMGHFEPDPTLAAVEMDIHTEDALFLSPKDEIQRAIQRERVRWQGLKATHESPSALAAELLEKAEIPSFAELEAQQVSDLECLRRPRKESKEFLKKKFAESNFLTEDMLKKADPNEPVQPVGEDEVVLNVAIYHPEKHTRTQEFLVLGSQKLTELRDILYCLNDHIFDGPNLKSGYFFIENVFYNDLRDPTSIDYSQAIVDWVNSRRAATMPLAPSTATHRSATSTTTSTSQVPLESFTSRKMEEVTFSQLNLRIGAPYLYVHQGNCEHLLVFTELRRIHYRTGDEHLHAQDPLDRRLYPRQTFQGKVRRRKCSVCHIHSARYITVRDRLAPEPNCLYCDQCYRIFHYDAEGKLLYSDFEVYPYYHE